MPVKKRPAGAVEPSKGDEEAFRKGKKQKPDKRTDERGTTIRYRPKPALKDLDRIERAMARGMGALRGVLTSIVD
jgi:hypothetical protein